MLQAMLPNDRRVFCVNPLEAPIIFGQIAPYFKHGVSIEEGDTVVDVGANIGLFTLAACDWGKRAVRILAFEPIPELFQCLKANANRYELGSLITMPYALSRETGAIAFTHYPLLTSMSTAYPYDANAGSVQRGFRDILPQFPPFLRWIQRLPPKLQEGVLRFLLKILLRGRRVSCQAMSLSDAIREHGLTRIDLVKIDAEMAELDILQGVTAEDWMKIRKIVVEVHDVEGRLDKILSMLQSAGFRRVHHEQDPQMKEFGVHTVYAIRSEE
ncbi:MAG: FkbM family methyltransferase [Methylocystis sp.]